MTFGCCILFCFGDRVRLVSAEIKFGFVFFRCTHFRTDQTPIEFGTNPNILRGWLPLSCFVLDAGGSSERWILQLYSIVCAQLQVELELKLC